MIELQWIKSIDYKWLDLNRLDLRQVKGEGVYVIWHGGLNPRVVRVGQGNLAEKLALHRQSPRLMWYASQGNLFVTWAEISSRVHRDGIEIYLTQLFAPLLVDRVPAVPPIPVRSPFG